MKTVKASPAFARSIVSETARSKVGQLMPRPSTDARYGKLDDIIFTLTHHRALCRTCARYCLTQILHDPIGLYVARRSLHAYVDFIRETPARTLCVAMSRQLSSIIRNSNSHASPLSQGGYNSSADGRVFGMVKQWSEVIAGQSGVVGADVMVTAIDRGVHPLAVAVA